MSERQSQVNSSQIQPEESVSQVCERHSSQYDGADTSGAQSKRQRSESLDNLSECKNSEASGANKGGLTAIYAHIIVLPNKSRKCRYCDTTFSTTIRKHIETKHPKQVPGLEDRKPQLSKQQKVAQISFQKKQSMPAQVQEALAQLIVSEVLSFRVVDSAAFKNFIGCISEYKPPSRRTLLRMIYDKSNDLEEKLVLQLQKVDFVSFTTDGWTSRQNISYNAVTCHWLDADFKLKHTLVDFSQAVGKHSGFNLANYLVKLIDDSNLSNKVVSVVTDNAANMLECVRILQRTQQGLVHYRCSAHTINLAVKAGLTHLQGTFDNVRNIILTVRRSPFQTETFLKLQKVAQPELKSQLKLIIDVDTRWNSVLLMIQRVMQLQPTVNMFVEHYCQAGQSHINKVSQYEWSSLQMMCQLLQVFHDVTKQLSASEYPTVALVRPLTVALYKHIDKFMEREVIDTDTTQEEIIQFGGIAKCCTTEMRLAAKAIQEKLFVHVTKNWPIELDIAYLLHPMYKQLAILEDRLYIPLDNKVKIYILSDKSVRDQMLGFMERVILPDKQPSRQVVPQQDGLLSMFSSNFVSQPESQSAVQELERYMSDVSGASPDFDMLQWWSANGYKYPRLEIIARQLLCCSATSVPSEETFSKSGYFITDRRNRLSPKTIRATMLYKSFLRLTQPESHEEDDFQLYQELQKGVIESDDEEDIEEKE